MNRLAKESSPYLLQHANNPVDWFPWCEEAFEKARQEDKPIFLSIGYSTCHWCHVMARESFEDEKIAEFLNKNFVSIKVDREERPDIDNIYMQVCQIITGRGGWPLSIFMTADKKPFYAGTYFPKFSYAGRIGFYDLLNHIIHLWKTRKDELLRSTDEITRYLSLQVSSKSEQYLHQDILTRTFSSLKNNFDEKHGGFGIAPKFPSPHNLIFLFNYYLEFNEVDSLKMALKTLEEMRKGGIFDQIGFGFHRYSTDEKWLVPHFEKMLYDQAALIEAYTFAYKLTKDNFYKNVVYEIYSYLNNEMLSDNDAYYSAQDADSEGEEGKYYLWTTEEIRNILPDKYEIIKDIFNLAEEGNFLNEFTRKLTGKNILYLSDRLNNVLNKFGLEFKEYEIIRKSLLEFRSKKIPPLKDDKVLTDWNSLLISSLVKAYLIFDDEEFLKSALSCYNFLIKNMFNGEKLFHVWKDNKAYIEGFLDDYAFLIRASLDLYKATMKEDYLVNAITLNLVLQKEFWDEESGGFYFTSKSDDNIVRTKILYDGAIPSGNSVQFENLIRLFKLTGDVNISGQIEKIISTFAYQVNNASLGYTYFLNSYLLLNKKSYELVILSENLDAETIQKLSGYDNLYCIWLTNSNREKIIEFVPWIKEYKKLNDKRTFYLCENFVCDLPTNDIEEIIKNFSKG
ncbi:MAG: thioredoxin domain-containing protein [Melioribacter sp.]|nr:thioredoxin domain-containing protein [Melioribacter sp.]